MWLSQNPKTDVNNSSPVSRPVASSLPCLLPRSPDKETEVDPGGVQRPLWFNQSSQRVWDGHVARLAGLWLDRFLKKGSRWNNLVESSVPQILLRQVFYSLAGNGIAFGSLRRGKREEGVLVMLIFRTGFGLSGRRQRCAPAESLGALPGSLPPLPFSSLDRAALALSVSAGSGMPSASPSATPFPLPGTPWLPGKFLLIL